MRPLFRRPSRRSYKTYQSYWNDLFDAYGPFCAYCETRTRDLDVEHVEPKSLVPGKKTSWRNLVLACLTCNRDFKRANNANRDGYVFPDYDETLKVFHYRRDGTVGAVTRASVATRKLCGLNRDAAIGSRQDALKRAIDTRKEFNAGTRKPEDIIVWAAVLGYWSIWVSVYHDVPAMMTLLCDHRYFPGTRATFLHPNNRPLIRI
ncbi:HNH endonuclease [Pseudomonas syringae]|uniref:HNH endonuclease n=1 Tax=Pseudomonas syringae TaxID=317 RepID=UPI00070A9DE2|nr:HNH endonuclease signature motif containing protein [Pseudomonas syringae]KWS44352.1 hypothetical protein AL060_13815 [Pseudomonas syringae pv. rhaphiolepidis]